MRLNLRSKMLLFAAVIAALPLLVAGQSIIRVARDELKSAANEQLAATANQLADEFNDFFEYSLFTPLDLIRNSLGGDKLGFEEKIVILKQGIADLPDVVALQVDVEGLPRPIIVAQEAYFNKLKAHFEAPMDILRVESEAVGADATASRAASGLAYIGETGDWLAVASLPVPQGIGGRTAVLHARINLARLKNVIAHHPFARTGTIHVLNSEKTVVFATTDSAYGHESVERKALDMLANRTGTIAVEPFPLADGSISLGAITIPRAFPWAIVVEKAERDAYAPVWDMIRNLGVWLAIGLAAALAGALVFALGISRPILRIGSAATEIAKGNLDIRVEGVRSRDEIGDLAGRFNDMIVQLNERFELQKFVSLGTMKAIQGSDERTVSLGGERRRVAMLFADIRGYTAFSENREPEVVVAVLNSYFQRLADLVVAHHGDIDKYVGDQIMAVFGGQRMAKHAVECAIAMMTAMDEMEGESGADLQIGIGVHVGEVVVGAMGSSQRKDFTVLGDHVNLAARLCSHADPAVTLVSREVLDELPEKLASRAAKLTPIKVKGKTRPIEIFGFHGSGGGAPAAGQTEADQAQVGDAG
ncbi:HAMP domain-containing protein [Nitratireductor mangrovi]|uniref:HAMP domain-containing protein n=1 Tax=Nitratireductor mangrovi TaxID=2599600 RepID=A0A5B8L0R5_9HYPH|nr:adenylate/guanylate cyclase domain-containing protein [Nitratireductor mangrovi]QDZ01168.1 HAMP domain-containing protein [Nitratireductor mangrovi]